MSQATVAKGFVKRKVIYGLQTLLVLASIALFAFLYYTNTQLTNLPGLSTQANGAPNYNRMIYGGFGEEGLNKPMDAAIIGQFIYVTDTNNKRVQVFDMGGTPIFKFGEEGEKAGQFTFPYGIDGDSRGYVYVADLYNGAVSIFDAKGKFIKYFAETNASEKLIEAPGGLRINDNKLYVTDIMQGKVQVFDMNGKKLMEVGKPGLKDGEFRAPNAVTVDRDGNIYVVDTGNQRVQVFDKTGKYLRKFNGSPNGKGNSVFVNPRGIGIDSRGIIYVVSNLTHYIYGYDKDGKQLFVFGGNGSANDKFALPNGLFIDNNDQILITDTTNQRVAVFQP